MIARRRLSGPAVSPEDASAKNSPAEFLAAVKLDPDLMRTARLDEGFGPKDSAPLRLYPKRTLEILCGLGILTGPDESGRRYRFSEMMIGTPSADRDYTATMINAVSGMIYRIPGRGSRRLLERDNIKEDMWPAVKEACRMDMLEELDRMAKPAAPQGRILWHIIENGLAASSQAYSFRQAVNNMSFGSSAVERVYMMGETETIESAMARIKDACANAVFDIALSDVRHIENVPAYEGDDRIMMLVFEGEVGGFSHIKGIVSALRALRMPNDEAIPMLERIYLVLSGKRYDGKAPPAELLDNPPEFARQFIFTLPPASSIPQDEIRRLNSRLLELLRSA